MANVLREMVTTIGYAAHCVGTAAQAREALATGHYAVLLLDLNLPDENGLNLAYSLYNKAGSPAVPIIIVSVLSREGIPQPIPFDIVDWINKPIDPQQLSKAIALALWPSTPPCPTVLHLDDDRDMLEVTAAALSGSAIVLKATDLKTARELVQRTTPDVVILDLYLEQGSGLDLLPMLIDQRGRAIPTILYSAHDIGPEAAVMVNAVLIKSRGSMPDIQATIRRVLHRHDKESI